MAENFRGCQTFSASDQCIWTYCNFSYFLSDLLSKLIIFYRLHKYKYNSTNTFLLTHIIWKLDKWRQLKNGHFGRHFMDFCFGVKRKGHSPVTSTYIMYGVYCVLCMVQNCLLVAQCTIFVKLEKRLIDFPILDAFFAQKMQ